MSVIVFIDVPLTISQLSVDMFYSHFDIAFKSKTCCFIFKLLYFRGHIAIGILHNKSKQCCWLQRYCFWLNWRTCPIIVRFKNVMIIQNNFQKSSYSRSHYDCCKMDLRIIERKFVRSFEVFCFLFLWSLATLSLFIMSDGKCPARLQIQF